MIFYLSNRVGKPACRCSQQSQSDCVIAVPTSSVACKTGQSGFAATVTKVEQHNDAAVVLELDVGAAAPVFLPGTVELVVAREGRATLAGLRSTGDSARTHLVLSLAS